VDQADRSPISQSVRLQRISQPEPSSSVRTSGVGLWSSCPTRNGESLLAVPDGASPQGSKAALLADLRARIATLERHTLPQSSHHLSHVERTAPLISPSSSSDAWCLGAAQIDGRLAGGLDVGSVHEIKPDGAGGAAGVWALALGFAMRLVVRRLAALRVPASSGRGQILWCWSSALARELGCPYGPGLACLGLEPSACLFVETQRAAEALWAMEEGLKSASVALVIGVLPEVALTPARRLSLAAAGTRTPCLMITDPRMPVAGSTATRWRIGAAPSAPHAFETAAPGARRYAVRLERCRDSAPMMSGAQVSSLVLEWSDATHRFRVASRLADRAATPHYAGRGAR
jgi:protein ImuA